eukprot:1349118-Amorphochlora_amoeboformis.AAC.3
MILYNKIVHCHLGALVEEVTGEEKVIPWLHKFQYVSVFSSCYTSTAIGTYLHEPREAHEESGVDTKRRGHRNRDNLRHVEHWALVKGVRHRSNDEAPVRNLEVSDDIQFSNLAKLA